MPKFARSDEPKVNQVQIKQRQCQSPKFKEFTSFDIWLPIAERDFEIWHSFDIWL